jgi:hypothetical protein
MNAAAKTKKYTMTCNNGEEMTLEMLIAWHQQRAADCFELAQRVTHMPKVDADALRATATFHIEAVRLLQTLGTST